MIRVNLDVDLISDELYFMILDELVKQFGEGYYDGRKITADKNNE